MNKVVLYSMLFLVASCGVKKDKEIINPGGDAGTDTVGTELVMTERPVYRPSETILTDLVHTKLEVNFSWKLSRMNGIATITAKPHFYKSNVVVLDAKGMDINGVTLNGQTLEFSYIEDVLSIELDRVYTKDETFTIVIDYVAKPDERTTGGSAAITSDKGLYFINPLGEDEDKMPQIWTQGETESSSVWFPTIDSPNAKTSQEIFITVDDKFVTLSNGALISSEKLENGQRVDHWKQELSHAPYLFMMGVGEFKIVKDSYTRLDGTVMEVNYYVEPEWEGSAKSIFGETPEMIRFFSERMGVEYPWDKYHQIIVRDYVSGAMENTGAVIFGDYAYKTDRELLDENDQSTIAHELFHHWFGDLVTAESWSNLTLNESFANYSQYLWDEHRYGLDEADYYAEDEADGYFQSAGMQGYHDLVWFEYDDKDDMFDGHSYNKGGRIVHMLRNYLGDDAFFAGLNKYLVDNQYQAAEFHDLRLAFEEVSGEDLNWFFNQWYQASGHPNLVFTQEIDEVNKKLLIRVEQTQDTELYPIFKIPFEIAVFDDDGKHIHEVVMDELVEEFEFGYTGQLKTYVYDFEQMVLSKKTISKDQEHYINQYYLGERYAARKAGLMEGTNGFNPKSQKMILAALNDKFWHIRVLALGKVSLLEGEYATKGLEIVRGMIANDPKSDVRVVAIAAIGQMVSDQDEVATILKERMSTDRSYSVISTALRALGGVDSEGALALAKDLENEKSSTVMTGVAHLYGVHGDKDKFEFFTRTLNGDIVGGFDKLDVLSSFTVFIKRFDADILDKGFDVYAQQYETGGFYMEMFMSQFLDHMDEVFTKRINALNVELKEYEKNDDALYADKARKEISALEAVQAKYREY